MWTSENAPSSTFGEYAKRAAPWEVERPTRCDAGRFYGTILPLHTPSLFTPPAQPNLPQSFNAAKTSFNPRRGPSWPLLYRLILRTLKPILAHAREEQPS
jgi:hypothetical protein